MHDGDGFDFANPSPDPDASEGQQGPAEAEVDEAAWAVARKGVVAGQEGLENGIIEVIRTCYDPEIPVNLYDMGLIYGIGIDTEGMVWIDMTLTSPHCSVAETLPIEVRERVRMCPGVKDVHVEIVWDPPWDIEMMSEAARLELGMF